MRVVACIIARGEGSTLINKNITPVFGRPLIEWSFCVCLRAKFIDETYIWTEDIQIAKITQEYNFKIIPRTKEQIYYHGGFSNPHEWSKIRNDFIGEHDIMVSLNCNYCLITSDILQEMYSKLMEDPMADKIVAVSKVDPHLYMINPKTGGLFPVFADHGLDRQMYPDLYRISGVIIAHRKRQREMVGLKTIHHEVPKKYLLDVHTKEDVELAEYYLKGKK